jgi:hypothetical protein
MEWVERSVQCHATQMLNLQSGKPPFRRYWAPSGYDLQITCLFEWISCKQKNGPCIGPAEVDSHPFSRELVPFTATEICCFRLQTESTDKERPAWNSR